MWWKIDPNEKWKFDLDENLKFGLLEILILYLLTEKDTYGYEIKKDLYIRTNGVFDVKEGSLYGPLYKLEERKLISSNKVLVGKKRFRNYYHIEDSGKEYLEFALEKYQEVPKGVSSLLNWFIFKDSHQYFAQGAFLNKTHISFKNVCLKSNYIFGL